MRMKKILPVLLLPALVAPLDADAAVDIGGVLLEVVGVEDVKFGTSGTEAVVLLSLERTGWPSVTLTGMDLDLVVSGDVVGKAWVEDSVKLSSGEAATVKVQCELSSMAGVASAIGGLLSGKGVSFQMVGEAKGRVFLFFPKTYEVETPLIEL